MINYNFTKADLNKPIAAIFGCPITLENFGLTKKDFDETELAFDYEWTLKKCDKLIDDRRWIEDEIRNWVNDVNTSIPHYGTVEEEIANFWKNDPLANDYPLPIRVSQDQIARCILFIGAAHSKERTLGIWLSKFAKSCGIKMCKEGNLVEYIGSVDTQILFVRGW